ncbi:MAG TPA: hypothetical protein VHV79_00445 [Mycobacteriales bacterium]|jgi:hypothetical protein|nr:hypothetical protein [Mycobacteriales bacterium]
MTEKTPQREPQHFLGVPLSTGSPSIRVDPTEPRVLGLPRSWFRVAPIELTWLRHPIRWSRWRLEVRRLGPHAPSFEEFSARA